MRCLSDMVFYIGFVDGLQGYRMKFTRPERQIFRRKESRETRTFETKRGGIAYGSEWNAEVIHPH